MSTLPLAEPQTTPFPPSDGPAPPQTPLAICLPSMPAEILSATLAKLQQAFPGEPLLVASPDSSEEQAGSGTRLVPYPVQRTESEWVLNASDYAAAALVAEEHRAADVLLLGPEAASLNTAAIASLRQTLASGIDVVIPRYQIGPRQALVNTALLYPLTRALFGVDIRFPLSLDVGLSRRMLARLNAIARRSASSQEEELLWPVAEASIAGFTVRQTELIERTLPRPPQADLNVLFPFVTSSLFADVEAKAAYWQRARPLPTGRQAPASDRTGISASDEEQVRSLVEGFRLAFSNLREIWSLVLPPQSLLALKKLSQSTAETFTISPNLWARIVYDFALAFRLRTLNRGHLLGAMTPLYLAWVASALHSGSASDSLAEVTATAFEQEKPYLVSRWRWPDRFNP